MPLKENKETLTCNISVIYKDKNIIKNNILNCILEIIFFTFANIERSLINALCFELAFSTFLIAEKPFNMMEKESSKQLLLNG